MAGSPSIAGAPVPHCNGAPGQIVRPGVGLPARKSCSSIRGWSLDPLALRPPSETEDSAWVRTSSPASRPATGHPPGLPVQSPIQSPNKARLGHMPLYSSRVCLLPRRTGVGVAPEPVITNCPAQPGEAGNIAASLRRQLKAARWTLASANEYNGFWLRSGPATGSCFLEQHPHYDGVLAAPLCWRGAGVAERARLEIV